MLALDVLLDDLSFRAILIVVIKVLVIFVVGLVGTMLMVWFERKVIAFMQNRVGPDKAGPKGLLQTLADGVKLFFKEDLVPDKGDRFVFKLAPYLAFVPAFLVWSVIPLGGDFSNGKDGTVQILGRATKLQLADPPVGVLLLLALSSVAVYGPVDAVAGSPASSPRLFDEGAVCRPLGPYAESKLRGERELQALQAAGRLRVTVLRLGSVFGWAPAVRFDAVANRLAYLAGVRRPLTVYGAGEQRRPLLHVADASHAVRFALAHAEQVAGGLYNVVGENARVLDVVAALRALQPATQVHFTEQDVLTHLSLAVSGDRLNGLGWYPQVSLEAGLAELLDHLRGFVPFGAETWQEEGA